MRDIDYLIVGQGIAGTVLSYQLQKTGQNIKVIDSYNHHTSSHVGAGLFNPITGRRFVKTWMADIVFPFAQKFYKDFEEDFDTNIYFPNNILRVLSDENEEKEFILKSGYSDYKPYFENGETKKLDLKGLQTNSSYIEIKNSGNIDMPGLLGVFRNYLDEQGLLIESVFDYSQLDIHDDFVEWKGIKAKKIIFCEGHGVLQNPFFKWIPLVLAKGEVLTIYSENLDLEKIISKGIFILPLGENIYKVGSTYNWSFQDEKPTEEAKTELVKKLGKIINVKYTIMAHQSGIRPTVKDRRPIIGLHPQYPQLAIFNGLGTKGVSLAPYIGNELCEFLLYNKPIYMEININRFKR